MTDAYTEQGIKVFQVNDYEWFAAASADDALACALKLWGYETAEVAETDGCFERGDVRQCDLDENKVNVHPDAEDGKREIVTYRESVKRMLADGTKFPEWFAGRDS